MMRRACTVGLVATLSLLAVGCGGKPAAPASPATSSTAPSTSAAATPTTSPPPATTSPAPASSTTAPMPIGCTETRGWRADPQESAQSTTDALYKVRVGRHDCYDRVVFDINGPGDAGYSVRYVQVVGAEGTGDPVPVPGAALQVVVRAPAQGFDTSGHQPGVVLARTGDYLFTPDQLAGWSSLRAVRFAGSFEGQSTFAVGVRSAMPFRVLTLRDAQNQISHVVVDIAHG